MEVRGPAEETTLADRIIEEGHPKKTEILESKVNAHSKRIRFLREYGSFGLAYSTLQEGLEFFDTDGGYLAYTNRFGIACVLSDPITSHENKKNLLQTFLETKSNSCFCQVSRSTALILSELGFFINEMGTDFSIDIPSYTLEGRHKSNFRCAYDKILRKGLEVKELQGEAINWTSVERISEQWKRHRINRKNETSFLSRPIVYRDEVDVRKFFLVGSAGLIGYIFFDPIYRNGQIIGYFSNTKRYSDVAPNRFEHAVTRVALETFKKEGKKILSLGLGPFHNVTDIHYPASRATSYIMHLINVFGDGLIYNFQGLSVHKKSYRGNEEKVYFASKKRFPLWEGIGIAKACNLF